MNVREDLKAYIDDELTAFRRTEVQQELDNDAEARREMEFLRLLGGEIRESAVQPEAVGLEKTLRWLERSQSKSQRTNFPMWRVAVAVAGCGLLAFAMLPLLRSNRSDEATAEVTAAAPVAEASKAASPQPSGSQGAIQSDFDDKQPQEKALVNGSPDVSGKSPSTIAQAPGYAGQPGTAAKPLQRPLMIRTGSLALTVQSVQEAEREATHLVEAMNGIVQDTQVAQSEGSLASATMTVRVPEARFMAAMEALGKLGTVKTQSTTGEDVTTQVADVEARLKVMRAEEDQYITLLRGTRRIGEILEVKERLSQVREEVESLNAQRKALRSQSSYSTISLSMEEKSKAGKPAPPADWSDDTVSDAQNALSAIGRFLAKTAIYLGILSPIWVPLAIVGWWLRKRSMR